MSRIEQLIAELCPDGVEWKELGEVVEILDYLRKPISNDKRESGIYPYYGANGILGYVKDYIFNGTYLLFGEDGSVIHDDGTPVLTWAKGKIWVNNHAHVLSEIQESALLRYVYYCLSTIDVTSIVRGMPPKINQKSLRTILIPISPLPIQQEIVRILDTFTDLDAELQAELEARKKQYEHYRNQLLNFEGKEVEWKTLGGAGGIAEIGTGSRNTVDAIENGKYPFYVRSANILLIDHYEFDEEAILTSGDGVGVGKILHYVNGKYSLHQRAYRFRMKHHDISTKYVFYYMKNTFEKFILGSAVNSSVTSVRRPMLEKYKIPIPPLPEQERIVSILDKFEALVNDELPAEIAARRKQYEHYREKLLTFKPLVS